MRKAATLRGIIAAIITALIIISLSVSGGVQRVYAAASPRLEYDYSDVLDDLKQSTIDGKPFDVADYPFTTEKETQVISFVEYCYAYNASARDNYGLYVYVYNPQHVDFEFGSSSNKLQFAYGADATNEVNYKVYALKLLDVSQDGKFVKYKISMTDAQRGEILSTLDASSRVYRVSGITLRTKGARLPEEYPIATTFTYTGYAKGYGKNSEALSTLTCMRQELETVPLNVKGTYYRYAQNQNTATQINSVYFAVDNKLLKKYGTIYRIWAEYWQYNLAPIVVTSNDDLYRAILNAPPVVDSTTTGGAGGRSSNFRYYLAGYTNTVGEYSCDWLYGGYPYSQLNGISFKPNAGCLYDQKKPMIFKSDTPSEMFISREELFEAMYALAASTGAPEGELNTVVLRSGKGYTPIDITADDLFDIQGFNASTELANWFYNIFFGANLNPIENIKPIYPVEPTDLKSKDICNDLLISTEDEQEFKDYCSEAQKDDKTVFLFRYGTSAYKELNCDAFHIDNYFKSVYSNSVRFQTIDRNFDIIQLGFGNAKQLVIIPVVASPIDNLAGSQGMSQIIRETSEHKGLPLWVIIVIIVVALLLITLIIIPKRVVIRKNVTKAKKPKKDKDNGREKAKQKGIKKAAGKRGDK